MMAVAPCQGGTHRCPFTARPAYLQIVDQLARLVPLEASLRDGQYDDRNVVLDGLMHLQQAPWPRKHVFGREQHDTIRDMHAVVEEHPQVLQIIRVEEDALAQHAR